MGTIDLTNPYEPPRGEQRPANRRVGAFACGYAAQVAGFGFSLGAMVVLYLESTFGYEASRGLVPWGIVSGAVGGLLLLVGSVPTVLEIRSKLRGLDRAIAEIRGERP